MRVRTTFVLRFALVATLIGFGGMAEAASAVGAGPLYGGPFSTGVAFVCRVFNYGLVSVTLSERQIWDNAGNAVLVSSDSCNVALGVGKSCAFSAPISGNLAFSCRVVAGGSNPKISGVAEIQDVTFSVLARIPFR